MVLALEIIAYIWKTKPVVMQLRHLPVLSLFLLICSCGHTPPKGANGVVYKSAVEYNDYIVSRQSRVIENMMKLTEVAQINLDSAGHLLDKYVNETGGMITDLKGMPDYNGDSSLRDVALEMFSFYRNVFNKDYRDIIHLRSEQDGLSTETEDQISSILKRIGEEEEGYDSRLQRAQENFAKRNDMKLVESEMQKKFEDRMKEKEEK